MKYISTENRVILDIKPLGEEMVNVGGVELALVKDVRYGKVDRLESESGMINERILKLKKRRDNLGSYQVVELGAINKLISELSEMIVQIEENEVEPEDKFDVVELNQNYGIVVEVPSLITKNGYGFDFDKEVELMVGDEVWFHHNVRKDNFWLGEGNFYWCGYDMIYAYKRNGEIRTVGDWCLSEITMESDSDIKTDSGIYIKSATGEKYLEATLAIVGTPKIKERWMWNDFQMKVGDKVIYSPSSDIKIKVDGKIFYRFQFEDIMLIEKEGKFIPVREWVKVKPDKPKTEYGTSGLIIPDAYRSKTFTGEVLDAGNGCKNVKKGMRVSYLGGWNYEWEDHLLMPEDKIFMELL